MSSSPTSTSSARPAIFALFSHAATSSHTSELDIEAQHPQPSPARTHTARALRGSTDDTTDAIDDFFGAARSSSPHRAHTMTGTRESRHDEPRSTIALEAESDDDSTPPPPYYEPHRSSAEPPAYTQVADQPTLAMYLFKFGFLFPLFWAAGALILLSPLRAPEDWETGKPERERAELIESMRRTEIKWARRCLGALLALLLLVAVVAVSVACVTLRK
ncbi:hypothetical protein C8Q80DRAFT_1121636 [Daedaleopsis nitida]|nr:hypothetical protein C8Q80DRAFT_1121636 [Daedaleopsis nitida]